MEYLSGAGWLQVSAEGAGNEQLLSNAVDPEGLALNTYSAMVSVSVANASNSPQRYAVSLTVSDEPLPLPSDGGPPPGGQDAGVSGTDAGGQGPALENALLGGCALAPGSASPSSFWLLVGLLLWRRRRP